jgi:hypothetical protein
MPMRAISWILLAFTLFSSDSGRASDYVWERVAESSGLPQAYIYPVHVAPDGRFVALHPEGTWESRDGANWTPRALPWSGANALFTSYLQHDGATWVFGTFDKKSPVNAKPLAIDPIIKRTRNYQTWDIIGRSATLPKVLFYGAVSFQGAMWIVGGSDGQAARSDVWRSIDGMTWTAVLEGAPWAGCVAARPVVFRERIFIACSVIKSGRGPQVWSSGDGVTWQLETEAAASDEFTGQALAVFDGRLWLLGGYQGKSYASSLLVSEDGRRWRAESVPWPPRIGATVWVDAGGLFLTSGRRRDESSTWPKFVYYTDVWRLRRR